MKLSRRSILRQAAGAAVLPTLSGAAFARDYPVRPVRALVGYGAGSAPDILARLTFQFLSTRLGQPFVVEDRPGAGTNLATEAVVRAPPDGYTLLVITAPSMLSALLYDNLSFDFVRDIAPVGCIGGTPFVMVVTPSFPANTVAEFIAYAKTHPGQINMASQGSGTLSHIAGELFKMMAGVDLLHVPYHGEMEAQVDLLGGRAQVMFDPIVSTLANIRAGKLRALGVTTATRLNVLPDIPPVAEFVPGYDVEGWIGVGAPSGTPADVVDKINQAMIEAIGDAEVGKSIADLGTVPTAMTPGQFRARIADVIDKLGGAIRFANVKAG